MDDNDPNLDYDAFKRFDVDALKTFLRQRGLSVTGRKDVLVARAFAAHEAKVEKVLTTKEKDIIRQDEYRRLLTTDEGILPDPFHELQTGWLAEKDGTRQWPPCLIEDISFFLVNSEKSYNKTSLAKRLLCDYKEKKALSYFRSNFLYEIFYHNISQNSSYCFLKAKCTPSMRLRNVPHDVWILLRKSNGEIKSAYCTCFAGLGQTCNHVAAVLFKVDDAWKTGKVSEDMSCTSKPCVWNVPKNTTVEAIRVADMEISKPNIERKSRSISAAKRNLFQTCNMKKGMTENEFLEKLAEITPDAVTLGERKPERNIVYRKYDALRAPLVSIPPSIEDLAASSEDIPNLLDKLYFLEPQKLKNIEIATKEQNNNVWTAQRRGRITASKFHRVHTRMISYNKDATCDMTAVIREVLQYTKAPSEIPSLKYGKRMEGTAAGVYYTVLTDLGHINVKVQSCGLFVPHECPFLGASPDRIVTCDCCGQRLLEIKCPLKSMHHIPSPEYVDCLETHDGILRLKRNHSYFTQIQGQMALSCITKCHFFVYSPKGYHLEEVLFDSDFWSPVSVNLSMFFITFLAPELVYRTLQKSGHVQRSLLNSLPKLERKEQTKFDTVKRRQKRSQVKKTKDVKKKEPAPVYLCGSCAKKCLNDVQTWHDSSIFCDKCKFWFHMPCVGLREDSSDLQNEEYSCPNCRLACKK